MLAASSRMGGSSAIVTDAGSGEGGDTGKLGRDSIEGIINSSRHMSNLPIETLESLYPIHVESYGSCPDSGGLGEFRGGLGLTRSYSLFAEEAILQERANRTEYPPH